MLSTSWSEIQVLSSVLSNTLSMLRYMRRVGVLHSECCDSSSLIRFSSCMYCEVGGIYKIVIVSIITALTFFLLYTKIKRNFLSHCASILQSKCSLHSHSQL